MRNMRMSDWVYHIDDTVLRISLAGNIVYSALIGPLTDNVADTAMKHFDPIIAAFHEAPIRIYDGRAIPGGGFQISDACLNKMARWGAAVRKRHPGSIGYIVAIDPIGIGLSRMYKQRHGLGVGSLVVVRALSELPRDISAKLPGWAWTEI